MLAVKFKFMTILTHNPAKAKTIAKLPQRGRTNYLHV